MTKLTDSQARILSAFQKGIRLNESPHFDPYSSGFYWSEWPGFRVPRRNTLDSLISRGLVVREGDREMGWTYRLADERTASQ